METAALRSIYNAAYATAWQGDLTVNGRGDHDVAQDAAINAVIMQFDEREKAYSASVAKLREDRDAWNKVARGAGVCMTCALGAPEPIGCTDCLNTGWEGGAARGCVREDVYVEVVLALIGLTDAFLSRHGSFPLDRTNPNEIQWNDAMTTAYDNVGPPNSSMRKRTVRAVSSNKPIVGNPELESSNFSGLDPR